MSRSLGQPPSGDGVDEPRACNPTARYCVQWPILPECAPSRYLVVPSTHVRDLQLKVESLYNYAELYLIVIMSNTFPQLPPGADISPKIKVGKNIRQTSRTFVPSVFQQNHVTPQTTHLDKVTSPCLFISHRRHRFPRLGELSQHYNPFLLYRTNILFAVFNFRLTQSLRSAEDWELNGKQRAV